MDIQIYQHFSLQRCSTSFSAARQKMQCSAANWHFCLPIYIHIYIYIEGIGLNCSDPNYWYEIWKAPWATYQMILYLIICRRDLVGVGSSGCAKLIKLLIISMMLMPATWFSIHINPIIRTIAFPEHTTAATTPHVDRDKIGIVVGKYSLWILNYAIFATFFSCFLCLNTRTFPYT